MEGFRLCRWSLFLMAFICGISQSTCFDIHVSDIDKSGIVVYNASMGSEWTYLLTCHLKQDLFIVDSFTGLLFLSNAPSCTVLLRNPFRITIVAVHRLTQAVVKIPVFIHIHGNNCQPNFKHTRRKWVHDFLQFPAKNTIVIESSLSENYGLCVEKLSELLYLSDFIPLQYTQNCELTFYSNNNVLFNIDPRSGVVSATHSRCFKGANHWFHVSVDSVCPPSILTTIPLRINLYTTQAVGKSELGFERRNRLRRETNASPVFSQRLYSLSVLEEQRPGYVVETVTASDPDSGQDGSLSYYLVATGDVRSQDMFAIDEVSGQITTTETLDREVIDVHLFTINAEDHASEPRTAQATVRIMVEDINDHSPEFESDVYSRDISEYTGSGTTVLTVRAVDGDTGANSEINYSLLNPSGVNSAFRIESDLGSIVTRSELNREEVDFYALHIQATDKAAISERRTATTTVQISIMDENDNNPQFTKNSYTFNVSEDIDASGHPVIEEIHATDADAGSNSVIRYSIIGGNNDGLFAIDAISGQLSLLAPVDFETNPTGFRLNVRAKDGGSPPKTNSTNVLIRLIDVNDNSPRFYTSQYHESVSEDIAIGHNIITVNAHDPDYGENSRLSFELEEAPDDIPIQIDSTTGQITTKDRLDREIEASYNFKVIAYDHGYPPRSATAAVEITVRDINDNNPVFTPDVYHIGVSEEDSPGTPVINVMASDNDEGERLAYAITAGNINNAFNIISQMGTGLITVGRVLNYKEQNKYILTVTATDSGGRLDTATVFINVSDANTYRPVFQNAPYHVRVDEDASVSTTVVTIIARDDDVGMNAQIVYSMDVSDVFSINPTTGDITIKQALDRETDPGYTLSVTATDQGRPQKSDTTDVEIIVHDVNDNYPVFSSQAYSGQIREDALEGTSILTIYASDADEGLNGNVRYTFQGGNNGDGDFRLDPTSGILRTNKELDRERVANYALTAFAVDRGATIKSTSVIINIDVQDVNDNSPQFETSRMHVYIPENSPIGSTVETIRATDPDAGANAEIEYSIVGGPDQNNFALLQRQGDQIAIITTNIELDYEGVKNEYEIELRATSKHLFSEVSIVIHVQDRNDNPPMLKDFTIIVNNFANHFPSGIIGQIPARDPDVSDNLRYNILSGNTANLLHLDTELGALQLDARLNSDVPYNGTMQVSVTDGINEVRATARLFVRLVTTDMLYNSITVRLRNIDSTVFLSPLYQQFVNAIADIIETTADNVFIVNVQDDTDVQEKVLNVSFSVRRRVDGAHDVFYSQEFLRERVYLRRTRLAKTSTLQVLPFDDNLCIVEPCLNYEQCVTILAFGEAAEFAFSDTMLFRPIHPVNQFVCLCPQGFAGMRQENMCDTEVNLCYSNPCSGNGTCLQREGGYTCKCHPGFTGEQCDIDMEKRYDRCPSHICKAPSVCTPLIRGGFRCEVCAEQRQDSTERCEECAAKPHHTAFCALRTRSFRHGDFLLYPSLKIRHRFTITLSFATREKNALLFYNGRYNEKHDFVALEIVDGQVQFSFSLGSKVNTVGPEVDGGVSDGNWHQVKVEYLSRTATVTVGETCDTQLSLRYGRGMSPPYTCAASTTHVLEPRCAENPTEICNRLLDLTGPFQIGGVPQLQADFQMQNKNFAGCIQDVYIDHKFLDLNDFVANNNTQKGCADKETFCRDNTCRNGGTCSEVWGTYGCECADQWGGKDCSQQIESPWQLNGDGYLLFENRKPDAQFTWYNGLSFRTRDDTASLMRIEVGDKLVNIEIVGGLVHYIDYERTAVLDVVQVNDGQWHYLETRWIQTSQLIITLDYGLYQKTVPFGDWIVGQAVNKVYVGGAEDMVGSRTVVLNGFTGCVKDIRVGNGANAILRDPSTRRATRGCSADTPCSTNPCPAPATCVDEWNHHSCVCPGGRFGASCAPVCTSFNPCAHDSQCIDNRTAVNRYSCKCPIGKSGAYCEVEELSACPATWWGSPICGPCNCPREKGFNTSCDKQTGQCNCQKNHYKPQGSGRCFPCNCYKIGTMDGNEACDSRTGQCKCRENVVGRTCDACTSKFGEVTTRGCEVQYDKCPRQFAGGLWWDSVDLGAIAWKDCPGTGTEGRASRGCTDRGWKQPDMYNCTSLLFVQLQQKVVQLDNRELKINTFVAKQLAKDVYEATNETAELHGSDIMIANQILLHLLMYENKQSGLNLTHTQDRNFIQNIVNTVGRITTADTAQPWREMNRRLNVGAATLLRQLEMYSNTLAMNLHQLFTQPFDAVHENFVLGVDTILKENMTQFVNMPKFNNKINPGLFDPNTVARIPSSKLFTEVSSVQADASEILSNNKPVVAVGYLMFRTFGDLLGHAHTDDIEVPKYIPLSVNSPVLSLSVVDRGTPMTSGLAAPILFNFKMLETQNRTNPFCVYWKHTESGGKWSQDGCEVKSESVIQGNKYVTCSCDHMTSFAVLMAVYDKELPGTDPIKVEIFTYIAITIALICFALAFVVFCLIRGIDSNSNSIHINLAFVLFLANLVYVAGINQTKPQLGCKFVTIILHFFYLCTFSWLFVEVLHLYRMITEIRNINQGAMKFYYLLGYVVPGIIVCLAVGLQTDGYGENGEFCFFDTDVLLLWSFAAPIAIAVAMSIVVFVLAMRASCQGKAVEPEHSYMRYALYVVLCLMPVFAVTWIFGLIAVNNSITAFHYLFAIFTAIQGVIILLGYIVFSKQTKHDLRYTLQQLQGKKGLDDSINGSQTRASMLSRSALAYHHNESLEGGITRMSNKGISTTTSSTTTSKSGGAYRTEAYLAHAAAANIPTVNDTPTKIAGVKPYAERDQRKRGIPGDSDSDSELSAMEHPDMDLASSHSSDDDDDVTYPPWRQSSRHSSTQRAPVTKQRPVATVLPSTSATTVSSAPQQPHSQPQGSASPLSGNQVLYGPPYKKLVPTAPVSPKRSVKWAGDHINPHAESDIAPRSPEQIKLKLSHMNPSNDQSLHDSPYKGQNTDGETLGVSDIPRNKLSDLQTVHKSPSSPRDRVILSSQHGSITSESEYV